MRSVILAACVLFAAFVTVLALGGEPSRRPDRDTAAAYEPGAGMRLLGLLTSPFAPHARLGPAGLDGGATTVTIPPQPADRQVLQLALTGGHAAAVRLACADTVLCGQPLCLSRDGTRPGGCGDAGPLRSSGSLVVPKEGGRLTIEPAGGPVTVQVIR